MVLDDVARRADAVVVRRAAADADVLGHRDLDVVDVVGVPDRLEQLVGEAQRQQVLHRLLAEVVVDPEDVVRVEDVRDDVVELAGTLQVVTERLLDDDATPGALGRLGQPGPCELLADDRERARRDRQVERVVAAGAAADVQLLDGLPQPVERVVVVEGALHEPDALGHLPPGGLPERRPGVLAHRVVHDLLEVLTRPVPTREARQREPRGQEPAVGQVVHGGHELLAREVAGDAEDHEPARPGDPGEPAVPRVAERVAVRADLAGAHLASPESFCLAAAARPSETVDEELSPGGGELLDTLDLELTGDVVDVDAERRRAGRSPTARPPASR